MRTIKLYCSPEQAHEIEQDLANPNPDEDTVPCQAKVTFGPTAGWVQFDIERTDGKTEDFAAREEIQNTVIFALTHHANRTRTKLEEARKEAAHFESCFLKAKGFPT